ncbi:MAG: hypothetical protein IPP42_01815 [Saprospiraceae bacterium]|nr:hypothetical protein [Saprospiraceae bacterium]
MQGIHCTNDAPFVSRDWVSFVRVPAPTPGKFTSIRGGRSNGTDVPVEDLLTNRVFILQSPATRVDNGLVFFPEQNCPVQKRYIPIRWRLLLQPSKKNERISDSGQMGGPVRAVSGFSTLSDGDIMKTHVLQTIVGGKIEYHR